MKQASLIYSCVQAEELFTQVGKAIDEAIKEGVPPFEVAGILSNALQGMNMAIHPITQKMIEQADQLMKEEGET